MLLCCRSVRISISLLRCCSESLDRFSPQTKNSVGRWSGLELSGTAMVRPNLSFNNEEESQNFERMRERYTNGSQDAMQHSSSAVPDLDYKSEFPSLSESVTLSNRNIRKMKTKVVLSRSTMESPEPAGSPVENRAYHGNPLEVNSLSLAARTSVHARSNDDRAFGYEGVDGATSCSISQESSGRRPMNDMNTNVGPSPVAADLSLPTRFGKRSIASTGMYHTQSRSQQDKGRWNGNSNKSRLPQMMKPFDICESSLVASSFSKSKELWVKKFVTDGPREILRPGMVLLKNFLSLDDQVKIVRMCRALGLGEGGFYQPGFDDGRKLRLQMMCLGLDWDPQTKKYGETRRLDGARPPAIPENFTSITEKAIETAHNLIKIDVSAGNVADFLPHMRPNICIVNFYNTGGRLGLHQDKDESTESLQKGLPVVSISLGDAAEFLYGDQRDVDEAEKVVLESGDVLIFGGSSRHIFHGVASVIPDSAPAAFQQASKLRPGRLNLTFREF